VPRSLGPAAYGNFSFLTDFFTKVFAFFDNGTSMFYYTKISQKPNNKSITKFYWSYIGLTGIIVALILIPVSISSLHEFIWPDQQILFIWMAFLWAFFTLSNSILVKMVDAYALTSKGEIFRLLQKLIFVICVFLMLWLSLFSLLNFFIFQYFIIIFFSICLIFLLKKNGIYIYPKVSLKPTIRNSYIKEFYIYSKPLILLSLFSIITGIFDRWILQNYSGSEQQGYYGFSMRIASVCFLFTSALTPLILREFSIAFKDNDIVKIKKQYLKYSIMFFFLAAFIAIFASVQSNKIGILLGGIQFQKAHYAIMIMALYPIHQTLGQMNGSFFLATNNTRIYSNIGVFFQILGLPFVYFMIAPANLGGLNLGSEGLASKMVIIQILAIYTEMWYISKKINFSFLNVFIKQIIILFVLGTFAFSTFWIFDKCFENQFISFFLSGLSYTILVCIFVFLTPNFISSTRKEIVDLLKILYTKIYLIFKK
jgi:O-antigen/teichoic acid export membrane protein